MTLTKSFARLSVLLGVSLLASAGSAAAPDRPNILLVVVDDLRFDDFGAAGHPFARTPHIDRLARDGAQFRDMFAVTPLCSPSRANIVTGQYTRHHGILDNTERYKFIRYCELEGMNELYDLQQDPFELRNLIDSASSSALRRRMEGELDMLLAAQPSMPAPRR